MAESQGFTRPLRSNAWDTALSSCAWWAAQYHRPRKQHTWSLWVWGAFPFGGSSSCRWCRSLRRSCNAGLQVLRLISILSHPYYCWLMQDISEGRCAAYGCGHRALVSTFPFCNEHRDLPQPANSAPSPAQTPRRITVAPCRGDNCHDYGNATNHGYCNSRTRAPVRHW